MWIDLKKQLWKWRDVLITVPATTGIILGLRFVGLLQPLELSAYDLFFQLQPPEKTDDRIVIVAIDESDIQKYNSPITDANLAKLLNIIKQQQPRAIGLDIYRDLPVEPGHQELIAVFKSTPNLVGIRKVVGTGVSASPILEKLNQVAANDLLPDGDGKIRRVFLSLTDKRGKVFESLSASLAEKYLKAEKIEPELLDAKTLKYKFGKAILVPFRANDGGYVSSGATGSKIEDSKTEGSKTESYKLLANYRNFPDGFRTVSLTQVLEEQIPKDIFRDRLVLIGVTAESSSDYFITPHNNSTFGKSFTVTNGVELHANIASQLISSAIEGRPILQVWSKPMEYLWISVWAIAGGLIYCISRYTKQKNKHKQLLQLPWGTLAILIFGSGLAFCSYIAFLQGWWIPLVPALLALFISAILATSYTARSVHKIRQVFGRYLTDEVVSNLLETPEGLNLGGEKRKVTLLFSDLRGFSALFENVEPEQGVKAISLYLDVMTEVITKYKGTINEFVGDGIFVMFGAPIQRQDDIQRAVTCAIAMQLAMNEVNAELETMQIPALQMGIGIHTGEVLAGNIGSQRRAKYTVMGSNVNLASRIESYTVGGQILVSEAVFNQIKEIVRIDAQMRVKPKGFNDAIVMFDIGSINDLVLPEDKEHLVSLVQPIAMEWNAIEGKHVKAKSYTGNLIKLSANNAEIRVDTTLEPLTNLQITFIDCEKERKMDDVYAKVVEVDLEDLSHGWIRFTAVTSDIAEWLYDLRQNSTMISMSYEETELSRKIDNIAEQ
ncbi:adenylate/guanylate cyclase domain-containing protein [Pseudanabaena sp. UWO311]|uniref:CHASE2 domain-containing protein n=1 Tax=Pseudanabaena sp. UWO311 TaxID=2487337 RepID=UPI001157DAB4|nr:adenylate/guanylate cyclase domain-containing protein [Pseudanabaena sp. UWO311]TYQ28621.1 adenylate/guanylate cyclase domain-containing protein [Pseudanabaena sp. UWO311]